MFKTYRIKMLLIVLLIGMGFSSSVFAQSNTNLESDKKISAAAEKLNEIAEKLRQEQHKKDSASKNSKPKQNTGFDLSTPMPELWDDQTLELYLKSVREGLKYRISGFKHRSRVFEWQLFSSKLIFLIVILLVSAGMYFAAVQFHVSLASSDKESANKLKETEVEVSLQGLKIKSPILGVIILTISLAFFYLYLVYIYPISEIL